MGSQNKSSLADEFRNYSVTILRPGSEPINPDNEAFDVYLKTASGGKYSANFVTRGFIDWVFEKNRRTGECAGSAYFAMPRMVVVEQADEGTVRRTIDDMITNKEILYYFVKA